MLKQKCGKLENYLHYWFHVTLRDLGIKLCGKSRNMVIGIGNRATEIEIRLSAKAWFCEQKKSILYTMLENYASPGLFPIYIFGV